MALIAKTYHANNNKVILDYAKPWHALPNAASSPPTAATNPFRVTQSRTVTMILITAILIGLALLVAWDAGEAGRR